MTRRQFNKDGKVKMAKLAKAGGGTVTTELSGSFGDSISGRRVNFP
jgi:hypothetical protein